MWRVSGNVGTRISLVTFSPEFVAVVAKQPDPPSSRHTRKGGEIGVRAEQSEVSVRLIDP